MTQGRFQGASGRNPHVDRAGSPEQRFLDGQIAKYGLLDLQFNAPPSMLVSESAAGVPMLRELGFIGSDSENIAEEMSGDSGGCIEELRDGIAENMTYVMLFLKSFTPNVSEEMSTIDRMSRIRDPSKIEFPIEFTAVDACVANSSFA